MSSVCTVGEFLLGWGRTRTSPSRRLGVFAALVPALGNPFCPLAAAGLAGTSHAWS